MVDKIKKNNKIYNVNELRDFMAYDDVQVSEIFNKKVTQPKIYPGKKINLIDVCKNK